MLGAPEPRPWALRQAVEVRFTSSPASWYPATLTGLPTSSRPWYRVHFDDGDIMHGVGAADIRRPPTGDDLSSGPPHTTTPLRTLKAVWVAPPDGAPGEHRPAFVRRVFQAAPYHPPTNMVASDFVYVVADSVHSILDPSDSAARVMGHRICTHLLADHGAIVPPPADPNLLAAHGAIVPPPADPNPPRDIEDLLRSDDEGLHSGDEGLHRDDEGLHRGDEGLHRDDEGLHRDDEGLHSGDEGLHRDDVGLARGDGASSRGAVVTAPAVGDPISTTPARRGRRPNGSANSDLGPRTKRRR